MPSDSPSTAKIIPLVPRPHPKPEAGPSDLLVSLQAQSRAHLADGLEKMFKSADDDLFRRSESGDAVFFAGLRVLRLRTPLITRLFLERLDKEWSLRPPVATASRAEPASAVELSLVDDGELEETLALASLVGPVESSHAFELESLRQRWAVLKGGVDPQSVQSPCSPEAVATAFHDALADLEDLELPIRIVLYKHFDRHVVGDLGGLYHRLNEALAAAGILPDLRPQAPSVPRPMGSSGSSASGPSASSAEAPPAEAFSPAGPSGGAGYATLPQGPVGAPGVPWGALRQLMASSSAGAPEPSGAMGGGGWSSAVAGGPQVSEVLGSWGGGYGPAVPAASMRELGEALSALREIHHLLGVLSTSGVAPGDVKEHLLKKLGKDTPEAKALGEHEASIDAIGLIFDHVLKDPNLPTPVQALLARLQVPFIRVAVAEPHLLESSDQPARRLLDTLGEAGKTWSPEVDKEGELLARIEGVVTAVNEHFSDDPEVFSKQLDAFEKQQAEVRRRSLQTEQRSEEVAKGRDKLASAQSVVTRELVERTAGRPLPEWTRAMLLRHWHAYMMLLVSRDGPDSPAFRRALFFVEKVVDAQQEKNDGGRLALDTLIPSLLQQLRDGLTAVGVSVDESVKMAEAFEGYLTARTLPAGTPPPLATESRAPLVAPVFVRKKGPPAPAERLEQVKKIQVNDWLEMTDERGQASRGKVSWISSVTGRLLIVTVHGLRMGERTPDELAWMLERGQARVIESKPLFDRAMGSIMERLHR